MTRIPALDMNKPMANYNAVKIQINDPRTNISEGTKIDKNDIGNYNAVNIEVNRPTVDVIPKNIYSYPQSEKIVTADIAGVYPITTNNIPKLPVAYQTNLINNRTFVNAEIELEGLEKKTEKKESKEVIVPAPNLTTTEAEKKTSFKALSKVEIVPDAKIKPEVDINSVVSNLSSTDLDKQALQMEDIARTAMETPEKASQFLVTEVYNELIKIAQKDTTELAPPSEKQIETRRQIIINELVKEEAKKNNEDLKKIELPYNLTKEDIKAASELSPMEQAERNKEYSLYTTAILTKLYIDEVQTLTGNTVPLTDLPGVSTIVDTLRQNPNPSVKIASIDALRYINRAEYKEELISIFTIASNDSSPIVAKVANEALQDINNK